MKNLTSLLKTPTVRGESNLIIATQNSAMALRNLYDFPRTTEKEKTNMKTTIQRLVSMAVRRSTRRVGGHRLTHILLFLFLAVCPTVARAECGATGDIPFTITLLKPLQGAQNVAFRANGPWSRESPRGLFLRDLTVGQPCTFYAASDTIFSPFGVWILVLYDPNGRGATERDAFAIEKSGINRVDITVEPLPRNPEHFRVRIVTGGKPLAPDAPAEQSQASSPKEVSVDAWLGDSKDAASGIPESDKFSFFGTAGDTVTIRLEADTQRGNNGGKATLRFQDRQVTGTLPKTMRVQLAATGRCQIAVEQPSGGGEEDYRGGYVLKVESAQGAIEALAPALSVEK